MVSSVVPNGARQAQQRTVQIKGRQAVAPSDDLASMPAASRDSRRTSGRLNLQDDPGAGGNQRHVAAELQRVAEALFGVQQNDAIPDRLPTPERRREIPSAARQVLCLPAPLILFPSLLEPSGQQERVT